MCGRFSAAPAKNTRRTRPRNVLQHHSPIFKPSEESFWDKCLSLSNLEVSLSYLKLDEYPVSTDTCQLTVTFFRVLSEIRRSLVPFARITDSTVTGHQIKEPEEKMQMQMQMQMQEIIIGLQILVTSGPAEKFSIIGTVTDKTARWSLNTECRKSRNIFRKREEDVKNNKRRIAVTGFLAPSTPFVFAVCSV
jgi:hypothetical protein